MGEIWVRWLVKLFEIKFLRLANGKFWSNSGQQPNVGAKGSDMQCFAWEVAH